MAPAIIASEGRDTMIWYERMNKAINYIEDNLCGEIDFDEIAKIACQSSVSFQRTFSIVTEISVFEYIRRRKLTLAAFDLQNGNDKVIDIALKYGYESPEAFSRAFKETHGTSPSNVRKRVLPLKAYPRIAFLLSIKGEAVMEYKIERKEAFSVYGIEGIFTMDDGKHLVDIPAFWQKCMEDGSFDKLVKSTNDSQCRIHSVCDYRKTGGNTFPYMLFAHRTKDCNTDGFTQVEIPAATWAIFKSEKFPMAQTSTVVQGLTKRIYTDWLPTASFTKVEGYELELYFVSDSDNSTCEVWIRVEPK